MVAIVGLSGRAKLGISPSIPSGDVGTLVIARSARFGELLGIDGVNEGSLLPGLSGELGISPTILSRELGNDGGIPLPVLSGELGGGWGSPSS